MDFRSTALFEFLDSQERANILRHEVSSNEFNILRKCLRELTIQLLDCDELEATKVARQIRNLISEWLTVPLRFDQTLQTAMTSTLGPLSKAHSRWGFDVGNLCDTALRVVGEISASGNRSRDVLRDLLVDLIHTGESMRIYCHRTARSHFETLFEETGEPISPKALFLHSVRDYRNCEPFDVLIKFGPLRARGWGSAPDCLISAPRFRSLVHVVWSGCPDEHGFGYDPTGFDVVVEDADQVTAAPISSSIDNRTYWSSKKIYHLDSDTGSLDPSDEVDDLTLFESMYDPDERHAAILIVFDDRFGMLFPPYSRVLSFDPLILNEDAIGLRSPMEGLSEGMYVAAPLNYSADLGEIQAESGLYSEVWKSELRSQCSANQPALIDALRSSGVELLNLKQAIQKWCAPASTVIHAPQKAIHFKALLVVLGLESPIEGDRADQENLFQNAWNEIRKSRGEAIQAGVQEQELIEEQLIIVVVNMLTTIRDHASRSNAFTLDIPREYGIEGNPRFHCITAIEGGFSAPSTELKKVISLVSADKWRA